MLRWLLLRVHLHRGVAYIRHSSRTDQDLLEILELNLFLPLPEQFHPYEVLTFALCGQAFDLMR